MMGKAKDVDQKFKNELNLATSAFLRASPSRFCSRYDQTQRNCLSKLSQNQKIKIFQFDEGNGVSQLNSEYYLKKLDSIVYDPTKFKEINFNLDSNALEDCKSRSKKLWIKKANGIKYYLAT